MNNKAESSASIKIWVDADACPVAIREVLFRTANRLKVKTTLVANQSIYIPSSEFIERVTVPDGADIADDRIVEMVCAGDVVVTADIPLAARVVEKQAVAIGMRGELFDDASIHSRLASRNLMEQLRASGMETAGPKPFSQKDVQSFSNSLDRTLTKMIKRIK